MKIICAFFVLTWSVPYLFHLYAVTQKGPDGSRDNLRAHISNGDGPADQEAILDALFGNGTQREGIVNGVLIGGRQSDTSKGKPTPHDTYPDIRYALHQLGFYGGNLSGSTFTGGALPVNDALPSQNTMDWHQNHFHIYLQPPKPRAIEPALLLVNGTERANSGSPAVNESSLLAEAAKRLTPEILQKIRKQLIDICVGSNGPSYADDGGQPIYAGLPPGYEVLNTLQYPHGIKVSGTVKATLTQPPEHGKLSMSVVDSQSYPGASFEVFQYVPERDFFGEDRVAFEVTVNGQRVHVSYVIKVVKSHVDYACEQEGSGLGPTEAQQSIQFVLQEIKPLLRNPLADLNLSFQAADLDGAALAQVDEPSGTLTLDSTAAGHGWFIDATPGDNSEFLPTSAPNIFIAKPGSRAEGKMDMLSVLLHELGHALGLGHSSDAHDAMAGLLQPGVRRANKTGTDHVFQQNKTGTDHVFLLRQAQSEGQQ